MIATAAAGFTPDVRHRTDDYVVVQRLVASVMTVSDEEVKQAMRFALLRLKLVLEPTGAVPLALLLSGRLQVAGQRIGIILSGGNVDPVLLSDILSEGYSTTSTPNADTRPMTVAASEKPSR